MAVKFLLTDKIESTTDLGSITPTGSTDAERQTYMDGVNGNGGIDAWALPNSASDAYYLSRSPILVKHFKVKYVTDNNPAPSGAQVFDWPLRPNPHFTSFSVYIVASGTDSVELPIYKNSGGSVWMKLKADAYNGIADFDVSSIAQSLLSDSLTDLSNLSYSAEPALCGSFFVAFNDYEVLFISGVAEDWQDNSGQEVEYGRLYLLSDNRDLVKWSKGGVSWQESYPEVSVFNPHSTNETLGSVSQGASITLPARSITRLKVSNQTWINILNNEFGGGFTLTECDMSEKAPFMVRWINSHGGVDTYVFTRRQVLEQNIKTNGLRPLKAELGVFINSTRAYDITATRDIVCGVDNITNAVYTLLTSLAKSIHIDYFNDERAGTYGDSWPYHVVYPIWVAVTVKEFKGKRNNGTKTQNYEITLQLPDIKTF